MANPFLPDPLPTSGSPPMFETKNDLSPTIRQEAIELLNDRLADCIDLHTQVKHAHWSVKWDRSGIQVLPHF
jgi:hypothetical protein